MGILSTSPYISTQKNNPDLVEDGQTLSSLPSNNFNRWRCDPPYNAMTARNMYGTDLPV